MGFGFDKCAVHIILLLRERESRIGGFVPVIINLNCCGKLSSIGGMRQQYNKQSGDEAQEQAHIRARTKVS